MNPTHRNFWAPRLWFSAAVFGLIVAVLGSRILSAYGEYEHTFDPSKQNRLNIGSKSKISITDSDKAKTMHSRFALPRTRKMPWDKDFPWRWTEESIETTNKTDTASYLYTYSSSEPDWESQIDFKLPLEVPLNIQASSEHAITVDLKQAKLRNVALSEAGSIKATLPSFSRTSIDQNNGNLELLFRTKSVGRGLYVIKSKGKANIDAAKLTCMALQVTLGAAEANIKLPSAKTAKYTLESTTGKQTVVLPDRLKKGTININSTTGDIEVYVPSGFSGKVNMHSKSGTATSSVPTIGSNEALTLTIDSQKGNIKLLPKEKL